MTIKSKSSQSTGDSTSYLKSPGSFNLINNISGWIIFLIASATYLLTIEPTASFWDCGEFITSSYKLEVGHPPGAPFFMLSAKLFTLFASDVSQVAAMVNSFSAIVSAFTILFLFWSITHIARNIIIKEESLTTGNLIAIIGAGVVGALAYTFSDTFWFSAVEGEVYAYSSFFTAIVFWAILKWESAADEKFANRWIILIAYLMGLSIGVHLLNLLAIPAIVFVYYFKKYKPTKYGIIMASLTAIGILGVIMYFLIPGAVTFAANFELLFTNGFGMPYNTGTFVYVILLFGLLALGIYSTRKPSKYFIYVLSGVLVILLFFSSLSLIFWLIIIGAGAILVHKVSERAHVIYNYILTVVTVILIGYSSFALIIIRSSADTPMNQNQPDNAFSLLSYLNRDQYGDRPLFFGQYFNAPPTDYDKGSPIYVQKDGKYMISDYKMGYKYDSKYKSIFPRIYSSSSSPDHPKGYLEWIGLTEGDVYEPLLDQKTGKPVVDPYGSIVYDRQSPKEPPSFGKNLKFFFKYQIGYMYLRYFMWNFAGRQNDIQGEGENDIMNGNWISGVNFVDEARLGPQDKLPADMKNNPGKNKYYFLPLIFGLLGMAYMLMKNSKGTQSFWVVMLFFFFTGLAIVVYLNQPPYQPRERDYAYAGSFYAFSIWIGFGVLMIYEMFKKFSPSVIGSGLASVLGIIACPVILANQNWDDHNRSGRYTALDFASNYLNSCKPNAILFTNGDNDTFPLWYAQEVEGIRTDVRVINLSYLGTHWYINQHMRKAYNAAPAPFDFKPEQIVPGKLDVVYVQDLIKERSNLKKYMDFVKSEDPNTKLESRDGNSREAFFPGKHVWIGSDSAMIMSKKVVEPEDASKIVPRLEWDIQGNYVYKNQLAVLSLIASNNWDRPIYFATTVGNDGYYNLQNYFQLEGLAYRLVPINTQGNPYDMGHINTKIMYDNLMNKFKWGGIEKTGIYLDENNLRMLMNVKNNFSRLASQLLEEGKKDSAIKVLDKCEQLMPDKRIPYNYFNIFIAEVYYKAGQADKANKIIETLSNKTLENLRYLLSLPTKFKNKTVNETQHNMAIAQEILRTLSTNKQDEMMKTVSTKFQTVMQLE
jgi:hypothetical protein